LGGKDTVCLPEPVGTPLQMTEKLYVPVKDHPEFNFVGRILGPRGMTAKQLEQETGCKIMVRGKGSMRDKAKVIILIITIKMIVLFDNYLKKKN
jgi:protein quaking